MENYDLIPCNNKDCSYTDENKKCTHDCHMCIPNSYHCPWFMAQRYV